MDILQEISENLQKGDAQKVAGLVKKALDEGIEPSEILTNGMIAGMNIVGTKFKNNEIYVPEVLIASRAMKAGMEILRPILTETGVEPIGRVVIGTVKGDLHDIGKNLVKMMLEGTGFEVIDLGTDVEVEKFLEAVEKYNPNIVGMSALLTTTMPYMKTVIDELKKAGLREKVIVMVGGAPVTDRYAKEIGADGYAKDAATAAEKVKELLFERANSKKNGREEI